MYLNNKIILIASLLLWGVAFGYAQIDSNDTSRGEIVMTRSELISFLEKVAKARKDKIEYDLKNSNIQQYGVANASRFMPIGPPVPLNQNLNTMSRDDLMREVQGLNARLNAMYGYGTGGAGNSTTFITTPNGNQSAYYPYQTQTPQMQTPIVGGVPIANTNNIANGDLRWRIDSLERELVLLSTPKMDVEKQEDIVKLKHDLTQAKDSLITSSTLTPDAKEIVKRYGSSEMQVFFDNDVSEVSSQYRSEVENAAIALRKNPQLGVVLKGFASSTGNPKYNYDLSMRRNEAVKRILIDYGVFPDQISSVFYGEDSSSSEKNARRVDIKFIIK